MQLFMRWFISLALLAIVSAIVYGTFVAVRWFVNGTARMDGKESAATIAVCMTALVSVVIVVYTQQKTKSREIENAHRAQKAEIYKKFMGEVVIKLLGSAASQKLHDSSFQKQLEAILLSFTGDIIVWGTPPVIDAYRIFRKAGPDGKAEEILLFMDDLLQAMRHDLGNSNKGLMRGDLIKLFLKDPEALDALLNSEIARR